MNTDRKLITKKDAVVILILVIIALAALLLIRLNSGNAVTATVTVNGEVVKVINLTEAENETITLDNGIEILVENGKIGFLNSGCPDKICIKSGMLSHSGEAAACLPYRTVISLEGADGQVDTLTY